jgi:endoplasmic reticulum chaperone BiP
MAGAAAFGVEIGVPADHCLRYSRGAAPFYLGTAAAIHLGNTNSCIAGYDFAPESTYYQFCIPSWVAVTDNGTLSGEAALNHAALSPGTAISGFMPHDTKARVAFRLVGFQSRSSSSLLCF